MKPKVSIIIVHYHNQKVLFDCLKSIYRHQPRLSLEIIVVDNDEAKTIKSKLLQKYPRAKYVPSPQNLGYGAGNNLGAQHAQGKYLLVLNPDTILQKNTLKPLVEYLDQHPRTAAVSPLLAKKSQIPYPVQGTQTLTPLRAIFGLSFLNKLWPHNPVSQSYWINIKGKTQPIPTQVLPGSAFLIRASLFKKLQGFDPKFFLYFEESDLFKRLIEKKHQLFILPQARIIHLWAKSTPKSPQIKTIFNHSRFYYFKKHYGFLPALLVEFFTRLSSEILAISFLILLATWLRFYRLADLMTFIGDQGRDYLAARDMLLTGQWPLIGIPSSVPWLKQGPFFIWLVALAFKIGHFHPVAPAILTSTLGVLTVYLTYQLSRSWFNQKTALLASLIMATAPLVVIHSRLAYHISPIPLFSLLFLGSIYSWAQKKLSLFWPVFFWAILLQFELTSLPILLIIPTLAYLCRLKFSPTQILSALSAMLIPFIPKIIYDFTHKFTQTLGLIAWAGYRLVSAFGYSGKHTLSFSSIKQVTQTIFSYWQKFILWPSPYPALILALIILVALIKTKPKPLPLRLLIIFILINFLAFYLHAGPSEAYFPILFPAWAILSAWALTALKKPLIIFAFLIIPLFNLYYLTQNDFIPYGPTLSQRLKIVKLIKAQNQPFKLKNPSEIDFASYLDNYRYLFWWQNFPEDPTANLIITIHE